MGRNRRARPARLAEKLRQIRVGLGLTQEQMFRRLGETGSALWPGHIGEFETDRREPNLLVLLAYARAASTTGGGEILEVLLDDAMELPESLPIGSKRKGISRKGHAGPKK
jgi:transcriptional regulator with XRE-family HTH domain